MAANVGNQGGGSGGNYSVGQYGQDSQQQQAEMLQIAKIQQEFQKTATLVQAMITTSGQAFQVISGAMEKNEKAAETLGNRLGN